MTPNIHDTSITDVSHEPNTVTYNFADYNFIASNKLLLIKGLKI